jgi:hypothetical protein
MKLKFSPQIYEKYCNIKIMKFRPLETQLFLVEERIHMYVEANVNLSEFFERS